MHVATGARRWGGCLPRTLASSPHRSSSRCLQCLQCCRLLAKRGSPSLNAKPECAAVSPHLTSANTLTSLANVSKSGETIIGQHFQKAKKLITSSSHQSFHVTAKNHAPLKCIKNSKREARCSNSPVLVPLVGLSVRASADRWIRTVTCQVS